EVLELIQLRRFERDPVTRLLNRTHMPDDFRAVAKRKLPRAVFDYVEGGADEEIAIDANRQAFQRRKLNPQLLRDVSVTDLTGDLLGHHFAVPLGLAPTGYTRMMHPTGEVSACSAAKAKGIPYALSTMGTTTIEEVAATGHPNLWFQLYVTSDRRLSDPLVDRAAVAGYQALEITIDTVVTGRRTRDLRNGLTIPPQLSPRTIVDIGRRPSYWMGMLRSPAIGFANFTALSAEEVKGAASTRISTLFDQSLNWSDVESIRARWDGPLLLKGPIGPADARRALDVGVTGFHLSNHGGRQLDRCTPSIDMLAPLRAAVGPEVPIVIDSGIRHGADIAVSVALGADMAFIGRPYVYAVAAAGQRGVEHVIKLLSDQLRSVMQLSGVTTLAELRKHGPELLSDAG
ncbi:MAG TPA: alpha-hydroxy acid oxidase, partial [Ilumatobacteraceae bacterium]|nr:alpha-hydroxy acid oxidase [Ilumatobacteraceae bacterium]